VRAILALLPDFLAQRPGEILEAREAHTRVKWLVTAQQMIISRVTALEALQRDASARQSALESGHSPIEAALSEVRRDLLCLRSARESANRAECEVTELTAEVRSVRSKSKAALEALSRRADGAEERLSGEAVEVAALRAVGESVQKESALLHERLSRSEATVAQLAAEIAVLGGRSEGARKQLVADETKLSWLDKVKVDIARVASEVGAVGQLRVDIAALKDGTGACDSLMLFPLPLKLESMIATRFPLLFKEFHAKRFQLLRRGSRDGFGALEFHRRCDGRANTLTLISDTKGNVFGGFTPVMWETPSTYGMQKGDDSLRSFIFTLKNPHGVLPREFSLSTERNRPQSIAISDAITHLVIPVTFVDCGEFTSAAPGRESGRHHI
jgi:hypothetical protein